MSLRSLAIALAIIATTISVAYGQSLGDIARENREKKADSASAEHAKVITNKISHAGPGDRPGGTCCTAHDRSARQQKPRTKRG